jgi:hypothetical protein
MDGWMILILILGFWSSERLDGWRILIWILGFRSPERLDGWKILIRILGFWSPRDRDDEEDLKKSSVVGERERERACVVALSSPSTVLRCLPVFSAPIPALHMRDAEGNIPKKEGSLFAAVTARSYRVCFLFGGRDWLLEDQTKPELPEMI